MEQLSQSTTEAIEQFEQAIAELQPVWEAIRDLLIEWWRAVYEAIKRIIVFIQRLMLFAKLSSWHFPHGLAEFIVQHCPERWLPALQFA